MMGLFLLRWGERRGRGKEECLVDAVANVRRKGENILCVIGRASIVIESSTAGLIYLRLEFSLASKSKGSIVYRHERKSYKKNGRTNHMNRASRANKHERKEGRAVTEIRD